MKLSEHFDLSEFVISQTAARLGIENDPPQLVIDNLRVWCDQIGEPLRDRVGPVVVSSGYRCAELNRAVGGSSTSGHQQGYAADIIAPRVSLAQLADACCTLEFDQLILEFKSWVHVSHVSGRKQRAMILAAYRSVGEDRPIYEQITDADIPKWA